MNKKFLSAILFGALMITSTGTFVSCKDYDDDIDELWEQIDAQKSDLTSQVSALQSALDAAKSDIAAAKAAADAAKQAAETAKAEAIAEAIKQAKDLIADVEANAVSKEEYNKKVTELATDIAAISDDLKTVKADVDENAKAIAALQIQMAAVEKYKELIDGKASQEELNKVKELIQQLETAMDSMATSETINKLAAEVAKINESLVTLATSQLSSLVFQPDFYYQGIEAMWAKGFTYTAKEVKAVNADGDFGKDAPTSKSETTLIPDLVANYHINPTSASVPSEIDAYSFLVFDKAYARATTISPKVTKIAVNDGMLTVNAHITDGLIKDIAADDSVTVMALQVATGDTVVTSDYAAVKAENFKDLVIAAVDEIHPIATDDRHLFTTADSAIADTAHVVEILWNSEGMDIAELINTHYTDSKNAHKAWDKNAASGEVEKYGFKYSYELVGYHKGNNKTSESAHAALKGSVIRPQMTSGGKQQAWGYDQNKATKDREPLVRIILTDTVSNKIASVGYLKFNIVDKVTSSKSEVILTPNFPFAKGYTVDCSSDSIELALSWHQVEEQILAQLDKLGISKDDFHNDFTLDGDVTNATQYDSIKVDSKAVTAPVGVVSQTTWDPSDEMTEVLTWKVTNNEAYQIFKTGKTSITVNVRYSYEVSTGVYQYVYVTFAWTPQPLNWKPNGEIADAAKINMYWYAKNGAVAGAGYSDIHANVKQVISSDSKNCTFESEILNTLTGNKITVTSDPTYPAFADSVLNKSVVFAVPQDHLAKENNLYIVKGASGEKYSITVSDDKKTLNATKVGETTTNPVVVLSGDYNTLMTYQKNEFAKDILNYADHNFLNDGETFTAKLMFDAGLCDEVAYELKNKVFFVKYLRPVSAEPSDVDELVDATNGASIATLTLNLIDWRDKKFDVEADTKGDDGTVYDFYKFYGVDKVTADIENATTDLNNGTLGTTKLQDVTKLVDLRFGADTEGANEATTVTKGDNGKFYYYNNGTTLGKFTIRVPLKLTYKWGEIYTSVDLNINKTIQN